MTDVLALRQARRHVESFNEESSRAGQDREATERLDCEAFLQVGIDAYGWLVRADETIRKAVFQGQIEYDPQVDAAIQQLFRAWLVPCKLANEWIDRQLQRGLQVDNLQAFRQCEAQVRALVKALDSDVLSDPMRDLRDAALREHRDGQTAEFV